MFTIRFDPDRALIHIIHSDVWSVETVDRYHGELMAMLLPFVRRGEPVGMLVDCHDYPVQPKDVSCRFAELSATWPRPGETSLTGIAIISRSVLNKLQAERVLGPPVSIFLDRDEAMRWILAQAPALAE